jgi:hypothetical protein
MHSLACITTRGFCTKRQALLKPVDFLSHCLQGCSALRVFNLYVHTKQLSPYGFAQIITAQTGCRTAVQRATQYKFQRQ